MVQCLACDRLALRGEVELQRMAWLGFGQCGAKKQTGHYVSITRPRDCEDFVATDAEKEKARRNWIEGEKQK